VVTIFRNAALTLTLLSSVFALGQVEASVGQSRAPAALSCSPAPCVISPIQATQGGYDAPIAADPADPLNLILGNDNLDCPYPISSGFNLSWDGGGIWNLYCMQQLSYQGNDYGGEGGPILGYDLNGAAYIGGVYFDVEGQLPYGFEAVQRSDDGKTWGTPAPVVARANNTPSSCWMAVDDNSASPFVNSVYVSCVLGGPKAKGPQVVVSSSHNGGTTWNQVNVTSPQDFFFDAYTTMSIGRDGTVYLVWQYCNQGNACDNGAVYVVLSKSSDGGNTWSKPREIATVNLIYPLPNTNGTFVPDGPVIAADASGGPHSGNLYVAMYNWTGKFMQLQVIRSTDGGNTWSRPIPVSPGITHDQFLPWVSVSPAGVVGVSWLDRRNDPKNVNYQAYAGISLDGGLSYRNVQLTTAFSDPNKGEEKQQVGDYTGNTWDGPNEFVVAWMDNSQGGFNNVDFVGGIRLK
jgi:hypothetical protein